MDTSNRKCSPKFQVGDRVELTAYDKDYPRISVGSRGYIRSFGYHTNVATGQYSVAFVEYDNNQGHDTENRGMLSAWTKDLRHVPPEPKVMPESYGAY